MIENMDQIDDLDLKLLTQLQKDATLSQRELADRVGLSQNACWRRMQRLQASGMISASRVTVDLSRLGMDLTVFVMIRTSHHSKDWA